MTAAKLATDRKINMRESILNPSHLEQLMNAKKALACA
jgi:hypothetical protein